MSRRRALAGLAGLWVLFALLAGGAEGVRRTRSGEWLRYWKKAKLTNIAPLTGFSYVASLGRSDLSSHEEESPARLLENGKLWRDGNDLHAEIGEIGHGRFSFWHDTLYFSAWDNSDPRTNGRVYKIHYPLISARQARVVYGFAFLALAVAALSTARAVRSGELEPYPGFVVRGVRLARASATPVLIALGATALVAVAALRAAPRPPVPVDTAWNWAIGLNLLVAWHLRRRFGHALPGRVAAAFLVALATGYLMLTGFTPNRATGCHTKSESSAWDLFCVSGDSASYYYGYFPGSTRNPLYPLFIHAVTVGTDFNPQVYGARAVLGAPVTDPADPLFRVVRAQIVLLLAASLVACFGLMRSLGSPVPAGAFLWLYDHGYFTAFELNVILTEDLVQALLFLLVAALVAFLRVPRPWLLQAGAVLVGLVYLTRQAAAFSVVLLAAMMLWALLLDWRSWWRRCAVAAAVLAALVAIPDLYAFAKLGSLRRQQENLQYQYRIGHAMQYARAEDADLMPDAATRQWLAAAVVLRDQEHAKVDRTYATEFDRMVYYIFANLYSVATPPGSTATPEFLLRIANPILARHRLEYLKFGFRFWQHGLSLPGLARTGVAGWSPWFTYAALWFLILWLRDRHAVAGAALIVAHWFHVAIAALFAAPIPRMVWASEILVALAGVVLLWAAVERVAATVGRRKPPLPA